MPDIFQTLPTSELYELMEMHAKLIQHIATIIDSRDKASVDWDFTADLPRSMVLPTVDL